MKKTVLFALNSELVVFAHVMLNAMEMKTRGWQVAVVIDGDATKHIGLLRNETKPYADAWRKLRSSGVELCACKSCAARNTVEPACIEQNIKLCSDLTGHPGIAAYLEQGAEVLVF